MKGKAVSGLMLMLLLVIALTLTFNIQPAKANPGTIYIRADGSIDPPTAPITTIDNVTYTFTGNIYDSVVIQRNDIVVDGAGHTVYGAGYSGTGIDLSGRSNVTVKDVEITAFWYGIYLNGSSHNVFLGGSITHSWCGVWVRYSSNNSVFGSNVLNNDMGVDLGWSSNNTISGNGIENGIDLSHESSHNTINGNEITNGQEGVRVDQFSDGNTVSGNTIMNNGVGVSVVDSSGNIISENNVMNSTTGIGLSYSSGNIVSRNTLANSLSSGIICDSSSNNIVSGNTIANNHRGILLVWSNYNRIMENNVTANIDYGIRLRVSADNTIYHNTFVNDVNVLIEDTHPASSWDDGYPSGGNYWSDYTFADVTSGPNQDQPNSDGIGDAPYLVDNDFSTQDHYPLMKPYGGLHDIGITNISTSRTVIGQGYSLSLTVKIVNYGINLETFNITSYANTTLIATLVGITLPSRNSTTMTFIWNTAGAAKGDYTAGANATRVPGETASTDNTCTDGWVFVTIVGDVDGDDDVNLDDQHQVQVALFTAYPDPVYIRYNTAPIFTDIDSDDDVDVGDQRKQQLHMFESW